MRYKCNFCSSIINIEDEHTGLKVQCPSCLHSFTAPKSPYQEGTVIGDFIIGEKIGEGSIGAVFEAEQLSLARTVALKILLSNLADNKSVKLFLKEARAAARLSHANLVQGLAAGEENGICYMAMNYIKGETLWERIKRENHIPVDESLHIIQQVAEALFYAWDEAEIIHRDIKPENIMISDEGLVKIADLGLAVYQKETNKKTTDVSGSPSYMSPEQFMGEKLDTRSDIYSLGVSLYQMLSGELPFKSDTIEGVAKQHFEDEASSLSNVVPGISKTISTLVKRMMAKHPDDRFKDMESLLKRIWKIRQMTAPDLDLVPAVHTISMKRLDYNLNSLKSKKSSEIEKEIEKEELEENNIRKYKRLAILVPVLALVITIFIMIFFKRKETKIQIDNSLKKIEKIINDNSAGEEIQFQELKKRILSQKEKLELDKENIHYLLFDKKVDNLLFRMENKILRQKLSETEKDLVSAELKLQKLENESEWEAKQNKGNTP